MKPKNFMKRVMPVLVLLWTMIIGAMAASTSSGPHDVLVGETKRIDLPASVTQNASLSWRAVVTNGSGYVRVVEYTKSYVRVEGLAVTPDAGVIVTFHYQDQYYKSHTHDLKIRVKSAGQSSGTTGTSGKDNVTLPETMTLKVGESKQITASSSYGEVVFTWRTDDANVVTLKDDVTGTGNNRVTGVKAGTTVITARSQKGGWAQCTVTVTDESETNEIEMDDSEGVTDLPEKADVSYSRTFLKGWNSVCLPFALDLQQLVEGSQLAVFDKVVDEENSSKIVFASVERVDGGIPCLVYVPEDWEFHYDEKDVCLVQTPLNSGALKGSYTTSVIGGGCYKLNQSGTAWGITKALNAVCAPFRAYIDLAISSGVDVEIKVSNK